MTRPTEDGYAAGGPEAGGDPEVDPPPASDVGAGANADTGDPGVAPASERSVLPPDRRPSTSLLTWGTVAVVLIIVIVLVAVKLTGNSSTTTGSTSPPPQPAPSAVVQAVTKIPASVYDAVGDDSPDAAVTPPSLLDAQPPLTIKGKPAVVFVGSEPCPYCAAERWAVVAALSRFGTFSGLESLESSSNEAFAGTPTFSFADTRYKSRYIAAELVEHYGTAKNSAGTSYSVLEPLTPVERSVLKRYGNVASGGAGSLLPFLDIANRAVARGGMFSPSIFQQLSATDVASGLTDAKDPATQAIVAAANELSASICAVDGQRPTAVCSSRGVTATRVAASKG